jgi:transcription antitermination protein NusB
MQTLYTWEIDRDIEVGKLEKQLESRMEKSTSLYLTDLLYVIEVCRYSMVHKAKGLAKYIKTEEDEQASTIIAGNAIVHYLDKNAQFNELVKKTGVRNHINPDIVKALFAELSSKPKYKEYAALAKPELEKDKEIIQLILKKVILSSKDMENHLEELFTNYHDDNSLLLHVIGKYVDAFDPAGKNAFFQGLDLWEDEKKYGVELMAKTIDHTDDLIKLIQPKLKNWEMDRVAILDLILLKLAVCELKFFPTIPVKVTINEYIEVSKLYSTPKSKDFVNGVLDKVKNELLDKGEIKKFGRGLVE